MGLKFGDMGIVIYLCIRKNHSSKSLIYGV